MGWILPAMDIVSVTDVEKMKNVLQSLLAYEIVLWDQNINVVAVAVTALVLLLSIGLVFKKKVALVKDKWIPFKLIEKEVVSHDVRRFRFQLQSKNHILGLPIGQHISLKFVDSEGKLVQRSYTPVTSDDDVGYVDFIVKVYFPLEPKFPKGGAMSQHLESLQIGQSIEMKGPKGHLDYKGRGKFTITKGNKGTKMYMMKKIGMVAGGTGITPMLQLLRAINKDPLDTTEVWLIFANQTEDDILLRQELESISSKTFHLHYTLDRPPRTGWHYSTGFINTEMCRHHLPSPDDDTMIFCCGPPPMIKFACEPSFKELGFKEEQWFSF